MDNNNSGNSYKFPVGYKRVKSSKFGEQSDNRRSVGWLQFSVPPPDNCASGPAMENARTIAMHQAQVSNPFSMLPMDGFFCRMPPPGFHNNFAYCVNNGMNAPPANGGHPFPAYAYQNPNVCNQFIINNSSHGMFNRFPPSNMLTVTQQPSNAFGGVPQVEESFEQCTQNTSKCDSPEGPITNHFDDLIQTALEGCKMAVSLASSNQKRPCFKKIDTLCANLQLDLVKADNVMANINSQGLAWAVKDFIFVFTRIMNAWIILKGYVHSQPAGLVDIQNELCPKFLDAFSRWHLSTHELTQSLIDSFVKLDKLAKTQRVGVAVHAKAKQPANDTEKEKPTDECLEKQSESCGFPNTDGAYIRTGLYETFKTPSGLARSPLFGGHKIAYPLSDPDTAQPYIIVSPKSSNNEPNESRKAPSSTVEKDRPASSFLDRRLMEKLHGTATASAIDALLEQVFAIEEAKYFSILNFTKNYFPDFQLVAKKCSDLRTIITNAEMGAYRKVSDLVEDLQELVDACKNCMEAFEMFELAKQDEKFARTLSTVQEQEVENIPQMLSFVAKMDLVLREARSFIYRQEADGKGSVTSSESSTETLIASSETIDV
uniref:Bromo domain-containing protein n=1 Tax=Anopheles atroparvus TaxID=41427 RepID=A0AAG5D9R3_ANOAO